MSNNRFPCRVFLFFFFLSLSSSCLSSVMRTLYIYNVYGGYLNLQNTWPIMFLLSFFSGVHWLGPECEIASPSVDGGLAASSRISSFFLPSSSSSFFGGIFTFAYRTFVDKRSSEGLMHRNVPSLMGLTRLSKSKSSWLESL